MHSAGGTADGGSRCDYSRRSGVSLRRGRKVGFSLLVDNEIAKWASATTAPFFFSWRALIYVALTPLWVQALTGLRSHAPAIINLS